jgi:predicted transcriptional regulator
MHLHLQRLEAAGLIVGSLELSEDGKAMKYYEAAQEEQLRQLVRRYEQLAENTLDAQQRVAADVSELRLRTTSIEQILRTVEQ